MEIGKHSPSVTSSSFVRIEEQLGMRKERYFRDSNHPTLSVQPQFLSFHRLIMKEDYEYPEHRHSRYELILVDKGPYRCTLNGRELKIEKGQALMVQPDDIHQDHLRKGQRHYVVHFSLHHAAHSEPWIQQLFPTPSAPDHRIAPGPFLQEIGFLETIGEEALESEWLAGNIQDALLNVIFWRVIRQFPQSSLCKSFVDQLLNASLADQFFNEIERNVYQHVSVADIAKNMNQSIRTLSHKITRLTGHSPLHWIRQSKVSAGKGLLRHQHLSVKETAYRLGFKNPFHFSQTFKSLTGKSPSIWLNEKNSTASPL